MTDLGPLFLDPVLVAKPWGGRRLEEFGKALQAGTSYGESWEVADLPEGANTEGDSSGARSPIAVGIHAGMTLRQLIEDHGTDLLGSADPTEDGDFPLLVKLLDARQHLSIQVHPTAEYVRAHHGSSLKSESWYVVDAAPGAVIYKDFIEGVTKDDIRAAGSSPGLVDLMHQHAATRGDFHHLPAGTVHALGAGVLVAEIQTPSDTTFRMYDWTNEYDRPARELYLAEALETMVVHHPDAVMQGPMDGVGDRLLTENRHYWQREHKAASSVLDLRPESEMRVLMVVSGQAILSEASGAATGMTTGTTVVVPAAVMASVSVKVDLEATVLEIGLS